MVKIAKSKKEIDDALEIRKEVFVNEQKIDKNIVIDDLENRSEHFLAYFDKIAVGTARVRYLDKNTAKIERMTILKEFRRKGIGTELLTYILNHLDNKDISNITMNAQLHAQDFYAKFGFKPVGEVFEEVGIKHIRMDKGEK